MQLKEVVTDPMLYDMGEPEQSPSEPIPQQPPRFVQRPPTSSNVRVVTESMLYDMGEPEQSPSVQIPQQPPRFIQRPPTSSNVRYKPHISFDREKWSHPPGPKTYIVQDPDTGDLMHVQQVN